MCTGNIEWSIRNKRYNLGFTKCDGTAEIVMQVWSRWIYDFRDSTAFVSSFAC